MELLPLEALNIIAENRTLYVLAVSSTVNVSWRGFFKQIWMWWPQCNADTAEYLETAECRVDLRFESQESEDSTQTSASTTVSVGWRGSFNQNWMWWQHCNADTAEYLEAAECRVDPRFESLESEDSTLTCLYKKAGDKEISIKESL
ncbi:hypothetical protein J6590_083175 [Homalodisca vitripennis]|nr:hypothetical protein J6590_083175 [Homalodisca vitripennis]